MKKIGRVVYNINIARVKGSMMTNENNAVETCCKETCCADGCCSDSCDTGECSTSCCSNGCCSESVNCCTE